MDMATCVARRTRSRTESYLKLLLNRAKGIPIEDQSQGPLNAKAEKKRTTMRDACSPPPLKTKRCRRSATAVDDVVFVSTISQEGKREHEHVEDDNVPSASVVSPRLESRALDRDRVSSSSVDDNNLKGEEKTSTFTPSAPVISGSDEVISLSFNEEDSREDVGTDTSVEVNGEYRDSGDSDDDDSDSNVESDSSDYIDEASESSYSESSESDYACSEDDAEEIRVRDSAKGRKNASDKVYTREKLKTNHRKNNLNVFELLANSIWERKKIFEEDESVEVDSREDAINRESSSKKLYKQGNRSSHGENQLNVLSPRENSSRRKDESLDGSGKSCDEQEARQFMKEDQPPLNQRFGCEEPEPIEKTEDEKELDRLWEEMAFALTLNGLHSSTAAKNGAVSCSKGKHEFVLDEEIGLKCCYCSYVAVEIRDFSPTMDKWHANVNDKNKYNDRKKDSLFNRLAFEPLDHSGCVGSLNNTEGTVWKYIPGIKDTLYPHQQEGFEFIWKNLVGTTKLDELNGLGIRESDGCIISHSPGTGKTRLTIVFLQSYLKRFPDCHPVVIAPASLLLTWAEEFKKWNADIPFFNMNSREFSGFEDPSALSILRGNRQHKHNKHSIRMVKLYSWRNKKSILGVSYPLYEKLAGKKSDDRELQEFRRMLLELPGLLILDEGHTPRNQNSYIWKVLSEVKTEKRIILSGTPFQNNFKELSNVLCLARPAYTDMISSRLQELTKLGQEGKSGRYYEEIGIAELRAVIAPFVHVHKGNVLRESLPGLRDCVVVLNPPYLQKKILDRIDPSQTIFELEHKHSAVSVHPSLFLSCNPTKKEKLLIGPSTMKVLERLRLDSNEGVKTRFVIDFIRFSESVKEKVLIFSQYIDTLKLIMEQLSAQLGWTEGEEIFFMHGQLEQKQRQFLINNFNKPDSEAKVLLASTKACSEGINLVGASRVILLDVVWNPSVERQAICRAYRIGQKRVVYTYHLVIKDTSEWDKYCKQSKKHRISELVFSSTNEKDKLKNSKVISEDRILDEMVRHEKLKNMFERIIYQPKESDVFASTL